MDQDQVNELRELIELLKANEVAEFEMERPEFKVRLQFVGAASAATSGAASGLDLAQLSRLMAGQTAGATATPTAEHASAGAPVQVAAVAEETLHTVKSPIVGTFYDSPSPGAPAFVKAGDQVEAGQVLCIVEAMKLMNEIEADVAGEVVKRIATSGQPVEYGQPLYSIRAR